MPEFRYRQLGLAPEGTHPAPVSTLARDGDGTMWIKRTGGSTAFGWIPLGDPGSGAGGSYYIDISDFGGIGDGITDNTNAINNAVSYAVAVGSPGIIAPWADDVFAFEGRIDMQDRDLIGHGPFNTVFQCQDPGAGFDFGFYTDPGTYTGLSGHFKIDGNNMATRQLVIGKRVLATFSNIYSWAADPDPESDSVCILIDALQNSLLDTVWAGGGAVCIRFDKGAANNYIAKSELSLGSKNMLEFRHTALAPGQFPYTLYNTIGGSTIIEGPTTTTEHMVYSVAGAMNALVDMAISVNGDILGDGQPIAMPNIVYASCEESVQSQLDCINVKMHGGSSTGAAVETAYNANVFGTFGAARMFLERGTCGQVPLMAKGNVVVGDPEPWSFSTTATRWDTAGIVTVIPHHESSAPNYFLGETPTSSFWVVQIDGEDNVRGYMDSSVITRLGDGTNPTDVTWFRTGVGQIGTLQDIKAFGKVLASSGLGAPTGAATAVGAVTKAMAIYNPATGALVGYIPVSDTYTPA